LSPSLCAICARTLGAEEPVNVYVSSRGERTVCARCAARAERIGWRTEAQIAAEGAAGGEGGGLAGLLRRRFRRSAPAVRPQPTAPPEPDRSPDPAAPGARGERRPPEHSPASPVERALERFNESDIGYTVEGLVRTLGPPWVSVGASAGSASELRITVAWELSWYQWGVDLRDEEQPIVELAKGSEIDQLDAAARQWNASAVGDGRIVLASEKPRFGEDETAAHRSG
jgi:hypothetical protein